MINELLNSKRFWSLVWRTGAMAGVFLLNAMVTHLSSLGLDTNATVFIGLILGEITKALKNYTNKV